MTQPRYLNRRTRRIATVTAESNGYVEYRYDGGKLQSMTERKFKQQFTAESGEEARG